MRRFQAACLLWVGWGWLGSQPVLNARSPEPPRSIRAVGGDSQEREGPQAPAVPAAAATPDTQPPAPGARPHNPTQEIAAQEPEGKALEIGPAQLRIGGYIGLTGLHRSTNSGGGLATKFASIPYGDQLRGNVSETRLSAESSRVSIRVDATFPEAHPRFRTLSGYFEMDFSGNTPGTVAVTSSSVGLRLRNAFAEVQYGDSFFMSAGQAYTLMTPARDQLSTWPSDLELSQAVDTSYLAGTVWGRYPQVRFAWRPSRTFNWALSVENPEQQIGDSLIALPDCCATDIEAQYNTGSDQLSVPNLMPDFVTRVAVNPRKALHVDVGGVVRAFRHTVQPYDESFRSIGGGASANVRLALLPRTRLLLQGAYGSGLGRYLGGLVPDVAFDRDGSITPIRCASWVGGLEQRVSSTTSIAGYWSGVAAERQYDVDSDGGYIGFGYPGAPNSNNRRIEELTGTFSYLLTATEHRGSVQLGIQASWVTRQPWDRGTGPASADAFLFFAQVRYNLP